MEAGIDASYDLIPVEPKEFVNRINDLRRIGYSGWNVTVPYKQAIIPLLDEIESVAKFSASVNTVVNKNGKLHGYSTDGYGLEMSIKESFGLGVCGGSFLFWGAGGATVAASTHFAINGVREIDLVNRTERKATILRTRLKKLAANIRVEVISPNNLSELKRRFRDVDVIIQGTSLGLKKTDPISIPEELLDSSPKIVDMIYVRTPLLEAAQNLGCPAIDGRGMLLHQGAKSFSIWTGVEAPLETMRDVLDQALKERLS